MKKTPRSILGKQRLLYLAVAALILSPIATAADEEGWYLGAGAGRARENINFENAFRLELPVGFVTNYYMESDQSFGAKVFAGFQFHQNFAVEGGYFDLGDFDYSTSGINPAGIMDGNFDVNGWNLDLVGLAPISDKFSLLGRVGYTLSETESSFSGSGSIPAASRSTQNSESGFKYGAGLQYKLTDAMAMRLELERYRVDGPARDNGDVDMVSFGVVYRFGQQKPVRQEPAPTPVVAIVVAPPAPTPTPPAPTIVVFSADSLFDFDESDIRAAGRADLDKFAANLVGVTYDTISVTGHSDRIGESAYNIALSLRRAEAVKAYMVQTGRLPEAKIITRGIDGSNPVTRPDDCPRAMATPELITCLQPDRRVVVEVTGTKQE
jgi:OOP family OmpA-OmpF porin